MSEPRGDDIPATPLELEFASRAAQRQAEEWVRDGSPKHRRRKRKYDPERGRYLYTDEVESGTESDTSVRPDSRDAEEVNEPEDTRGPAVRPGSTFGVRGECGSDETSVDLSDFSSDTPDDEGERGLKEKPTVEEERHTSQKPEDEDELAAARAAKGDNHWWRENNRDSPRLQLKEDSPAKVDKEPEAPAHAPAPTPAPSALTGLAVIGARAEQLAAAAEATAPAAKENPLSSSESQ